MNPRDAITRQVITDEKRDVALNLRKNQTPAETLLWSKLRASRLGGLHFRRQQIILGYVVDFYCHSAGAIVELDGGIHALRQEADAARQAVLENAGFRVLRFANESVTLDLKGTREYIVVFCNVEVRDGHPLPSTEGGRGIGGLERGSERDVNDS